MPAITNEEVQAALDAARPEIIKRLVKEFSDEVQRTVKWEMDKQVAKFVEDFFKTEIIPDMRVALVEEKPILLAAAIEGANQIGAALTQALVDEFKKKVSQSWERGKILEAMFK